MVCSPELRGIGELQASRAEACGISRSGERELMSEKKSPVAGPSLLEHWFRAAAALEATANRVLYRAGSDFRDGCGSNEAGLTKQNRQIWCRINVKY
jgi:hypothetical protein